MPTIPELRLIARDDPELPSHNTFGRLGSKSQLISRLREYCRGREGYEEVVRMCEEHSPRNQREESVASEHHECVIGFDYLIKSGRFYKIGMTNAIGRREYELAIQLPEPTATIHVIRTDDPSGIEAYWHRRFEAKRKNGEWFELDAADVSAFKRRKFM